MALTQITPIPVRVRWNRATHQPDTIRLRDRELPVRELAAVRDETAAYPAQRGPRITFLVETDGGQASLVFDGRRRAWYVEAMETAA